MTVLQRSRMCEYTATLPTEELPPSKTRALLYRKPESKLQDADFLTHFVQLTNVETSLSCSTECFSGPLQAAPQNIYVAADGDVWLQRSAASQPRAHTRSA